MQPKACRLAILALFLETQATAQKTQETHTVDINTRCNEMKYVLALSKYAEAKAVGARDGIDKLEHQALAWQLAAAQAQADDDKVAYTMMAMRAEVASKVARRAAAAITEQAEKTARLLKERLGYTSSLQHARSLTLGQGVYTDNPGGDSNKGCTYTPTQTAATTSGCDISGATADGVGEKKFNLQQATHITLSRSAKNTPFAPSATMPSQRNGQQHNRNRRWHKIMQRQQHDGFALPRLKTLANAKKSGAKSDEKPIYTLKQTLPNVSQPRPMNNCKQRNNEHVATALCRLLKRRKSQIPDLSDGDPATLKEQQEYLSMYTAYLRAQGKITTEEAIKPTDDIKKQLQSILGADKDGYNRKFVTYAKETKIALDPSQPNKEESLEDLAKGPKAGQALLYLLGKGAGQAKHAEWTCKAQATETEDSCNKKGQTECNSPCKWDPEEKDAKKKCTLSEEGEKAAAEKEANQETGGKDGKATNTAASNSFVINKAPLLLAVLLF
uniref:Variable surface glycoprotein n=1 Tax=Trypanosoma evansi TaxID=5697 RepID=Q968L6_TRYEV|nr:variable surface glycoprotein [Trypanosoma evansi]